MAWNVNGTYLESCNCDTVCPCTTSGLTAPADHERCQVTLAFHVARGEVDGVDVADHSVVVFADAPRVMADGGWQVVLYVDASADDSQADALGKVFSGQVGGPMAALAPSSARSSASNAFPSTSTTTVAVTRCGWRTPSTSRSRTRWPRSSARTVP